MLEQEKKNNQCVMPQMSLTVTQSGKVRPCCIYYGNVEDENP